MGAVQSSLAFTLILTHVHIVFFFLLQALGGNSLDAVRLVALSKGIITMKTLQEQPTLDEELVAASANETAIVILRREDDESPAPLSSAQRRLVVIDMLGSEESVSYHMPWFAEVDTGADISKLALGTRMP